MEYRILDKPHIRKTSSKQDGYIYQKRARRTWPWLVILEVADDGNTRGMAFADLVAAFAFARKSTYERLRVADKHKEANSHGYQHHED